MLPGDNGSPASLLQKNPHEKSMACGRGGSLPRFSAALVLREKPYYGCRHGGGEGSGVKDWPKPKSRRGGDSCAPSAASGHNSTASSRPHGFGRMTVSGEERPA